MYFVQQTNFIFDSVKNTQLRSQYLKMQANNYIVKQAYHYLLAILHFSYIFLNFVFVYLWITVHIECVPLAFNSESAPILYLSDHFGHEVKYLGIMNSLLQCQFSSTQIGDPYVV